MRARSTWSPPSLFSWRDELRPALAAEGIVIGAVDDATSDELAQLEDHFARQIFPVLTPLAVGPGQPFPYISGLSLNLGVVVSDPESGEERFARVKVPEGLSRWVAVGDRGLSIPLESVIEHFLSWLFPEMELIERTAFRLTRDGDTEISDDADDLLEAVETELRKRRFGAVVRLEVSSSVSRRDARAAGGAAARRRRERLSRHAACSTSPMSVSSTPLDRPELKYEPWVPFTQRRLATPAERRPVRGHRSTRSRRPASVRLVRDERRVVRAGCGAATPGS